MRKISREVAKFIREKSPNTAIAMTNKFASNKRKKQHYAGDTFVEKKLLKQFAEEVEVIRFTYGDVEIKEDF